VRQQHVLCPLGPTFNGRLDFVATLITGWINPAFLVTVALASFSRHRRLIAVLRIVVLLMVPFSWIEFHYQSVYPREGYFLWTVGMLLVLFSRELSRRDDRIGAMKPAAEGSR
jgi:hypothetical protein